MEKNNVRPIPANREHPLRVGVIGCGRAAVSLHIPVLARLAGVRVSALADADAAQLQAAGEGWGIERRYQDYRELLSDPAVDIVLITVPTRWHCEVFLAALQAGKHVYLEKPISIRAEDANRMLEAARGYRGSVVLGFNLRSHRLVNEVGAIVRSGALGPLASLRSVSIGDVKARPEWQRRREQGGGALFELGVHHYDLWRFLLGAEAVQVAAQSLSDGADDARAIVTARFSNGAMASSVFALQGVASNEIEINGERASLRFSLYRADSLEISPSGRVARLASWLKQLPAAAMNARRGGDFLDSYRRHWLRFLASIGNDAPPATLHDGQQALRIALAAVDSVNSGRLIPL